MNDFKITLTNYEFEIPSNWGIVVIANYRTGSTALCDYLSQLTGLPFLGEVFHFNPSSRPDTYDPEQRSIVKIMPNHMPPEEHWDSLFNNSYVIGLYREDFAAQVLSYAVSLRTGQWQQEKNADSVLTNSNMKLTTGHLSRYVNCLREIQTAWHDCESFFDITLQYEQLLPELAQSKFACFPKITTYDATLQRVRSLL
jgi:hypothetical protein